MELSLRGSPVSGVGDSAVLKNVYLRNEWFWFGVGWPRAITITSHRTSPKLIVVRVDSLFVVVCYTLNMLWLSNVVMCLFGISFLVDLLHADLTPQSSIRLLSTKHKQYTICVLEKKTNIYNSAEARCAVFQQYNAPIRCVIGTDRLDCLRRVSMQKADFAVFQAEELLIASNHRNLNNIFVVAEFQRSYSTFNKFQYGLVAVVRNELNVTSIRDLHGKRLCHPGVDPDGVDHSDIFSQFFEDRIVSHQCDPGKTVIENRVQSLADFFDVSCKAGPWTLDPLLDANLKKKFGSLCLQCDSPEICSEKDKYWGRRNALLCLSDCNGDFTWGRLQDVRYHFRQRNNNFDRRCSDVSFLCPDGSTQNLATENPCLWIQKPNTVVAAHSSVAKEIQDLILTVLVEQTDGADYRGALSILLESPPRFQTVDLVLASEYVREAQGFLSSASASRCGGDREIRICAASYYEKAQCEWLSAAADSYGIEPSVTCVLPAINSNCFAAVQGGHADVFLTDSDLLLPAVRDYDLKPLLYETVSDISHYKYFGVLFDSNQKITKWADLRGKRACFSAIDGVGWTSLVMALEQEKLLPNVCPHHAAVSQFFKDVCITRQLNNSITNQYKNIRYCNSELVDEYDKQFGIEREAVDCILTGGGDVAFIAVDSVQRYIDSTLSAWAKQLIGSRYKWLCKNNVVQDKPCFLTWSTMGQVLVYKNISYVRQEDIISTFKNLDALFGGGNGRKNKQSYAFDIFSEFQSSKDVLFQDLGDRLELAEMYLKKARGSELSYEFKIQNALHCKITSSVASIYFEKTTVFVLTFSLVFIKLIECICL